MEYTFYELPDMQKTGERKVYPKAFHCHQISFDNFLKEMARTSSFGQGTITGVLMEMVRTMNHYLQAGHSVKIDGLGTFNITLGMKNRDEVESLKEEGTRYDTNNVYIRTIKFLPDTEWIHQLRLGTELNKVGKVKTIRLTTSTEEERRQMALHFLEEHPVMRVIDYMKMTGLLHTVACRELRAFRRDPKSGIKCLGRGNALVYVKNNSEN